MPDNSDDKLSSTALINSLFNEVTMTSTWSAINHGPIIKVLKVVNDRVLCVPFLSIILAVINVK